VLPEVVCVYVCACCLAIEFLVLDAGELLACVRSADGPSWLCECTSGVMPDEPRAMCIHTYTASLLLPELVNAS
jgi:hypothetical protein